MDEVQIIFYIRNRTLKIKTFHKNIFEIFINLESRRDLQGVFGNILN